VTLLLNSELNILSDKLCKSIMTMNNHISFVAIIDQKGRIEESQGRDCIIEKLPDTRKEVFFMENALIHRMRKEFYQDFGKVRFTYLEMSRNGLFSFPIDNEKLLLVYFLRIHVNSPMLANRITRQIRKYVKKLEDLPTLIS
jgi:hypothetical protein